MNIKHHLEAVHQRITLYERRYHRPAGSVCLLAASKHQSIEKIQTAFDAGQRLFGENYLQEALGKMPLLDPAIEWHFIGAIQRNKTKKIAAHFAWVHSVENKIIAKRLSEERPDHLPPLSICIQVNLQHEKTKSGAPSDEILDLASYCQTLPRLHLRGLMIIPAPEQDFSKQRAIFHQVLLLRELLEKNDIALDTLSMGMSDDLEAAIAEGTTLVRIGRAIFGER